MQIITTAFVQTASSDDILVQLGHVGLLLRERPRRTSTKLHKHTFVALLQQRADTTLAEEITAVPLQGIDVTLQSGLRQRAGPSPRPPRDHLLERRQIGSLFFIGLCLYTCLSAYVSPLPGLRTSAKPKAFPAYQKHHHLKQAR